MEARVEHQVIDMREQYDAALLKQFYDTLMVPSFGIFDDELEDLETWIELLTKPKGASVFNLHVLLVFEGTDKERKRVIGGSACEYYPNSNCGLLTYFAVLPEFRQKGVGGFLVRNVLIAVDKDAKSNGKAGCNAVFLETNDAEKVKAEEDCMDPLVRHKILNKLGFRILDFTYVQPALSPTQAKCSNLLFAVHQSYLVDGKLKSEFIAAFIKEFFIVLMGDAVLATDEDYIKMTAEFKAKPLITAN